LKSVAPSVTPSTATLESDEVEATTIKPCPNWMQKISGRCEPPSNAPSPIPSVSPSTGITPRTEADEQEDARDGSTEKAHVAARAILSFMPSSASCSSRSTPTDAEQDAESATTQQNTHIGHRQCGQCEVTVSQLALNQHHQLQQPTARLADFTASNLAGYTHEQSEQDSMCGGSSGKATEYLVQIQTGDAKGSSDVEADFFIEIIGNNARSGPLRLAASDNEFRFVKNQKDTFVFVLPHLGEIVSFRIWRNTQRVYPACPWTRQRWLMVSASVFEKAKRTLFLNDIADGWVSDDLVELSPCRLSTDMQVDLAQDAWMEAGVIEGATVWPLRAHDANFIWM